MKIKPRRVAVTGRVLAVYPMDVFPTECPHHGNTRIAAITIGGHRLACGCEWHVLGGDGWYCTYQAEPAIEAGP